VSAPRGPGASPYLDLYNYRQQVAALYRERNRALVRGEQPQEVLATYRKRRDEIFATHPQSALSSAQRERFRGLQYYPSNPAAVVEATVRPARESPTRDSPFSSEGDGVEAMPLILVAHLDFMLVGWTGSLSLYWIDVYGGGLFLPFRDATAPAESYGGGRYLFDTVKGSDFLALPGKNGDHRILLDFNYAYNPSCAYNPVWVCPLAPRENNLPVRVEAGEMKYPDVSHP
jgi:uncharacterized protein (DUF1684 family)